MPTINLVAPVAGNTVTAAVFTNAYTQIQSACNGLDTANWASGLIFNSASIMQNGADTRSVLGWDGTNWSPQRCPTRFFDSTLGASAASVDIQNIPQTHQGLLLVTYARSDNASLNVNCSVRFNNDSGSNYDQQFLIGGTNSAIAAEAFGNTSAQISNIPAATAPANLFATGVTMIPNYANAANGQVTNSLFGAKWGTASSNMQVGSFSGFWRSVAAINRVTVLPVSGNFVAGTRVTLYGMP